MMAICKSTNGGVSWSRSILSTKPGGVYALALHPSNANIIFAGGVSDTNSAGKVLKSIDGGANWSDVSTGLAQNYNIVYALVIDPTAPDVIYAGCNYGVFKSTNGGLNWINLNTPFSAVRALLIDTSASPCRIYAGSASYGVYYSSDGGSSWQPMNQGLSNIQINCLGFDPQQKYLYAGTSGGGVFRRTISTDVRISPQSKLPAKLALTANYPNPFNATTVIGYEVPENIDDPVRLMIYNSSGQLVSKLLDAYQLPGQYKVSWDGLNDQGAPVASGMYIGVLTAGAQTTATKMMLIR